MKLQVLLAVLLALFLSIPAHVRSDEFSDFRIPDHRVISWTGDFFGMGRHSTNDFSSARSRFGSLFGTGGSAYHQLSDAEAGSTELFLSVFLGGDRGGTTARWEEQFLTLARRSDRRSSGRSTDERLEAGFSFVRYAGGTPLALGADTKARGNDSQAWSNSRNTEEQTSLASHIEQLTESNDRQRRTSTIVSIRSRVGLGRVRDATGVYVARVIEERLRATGALTQALTHEARQKMADLVTLRQDYGDVREAPAKGMWAEIERICREDGALAASGINAASTQRAGEPLLELVSRRRPADALPGAVLLRQRGTLAGVFVDGTHRRETRFDENDSRTQLTVDDVPQPIVSIHSGESAAATSDGVDAGIEAEWHRPVGWRLQLDAVVEASVPLRSKDDGFALAVRGSAGWLVADRWLVEGSLDEYRHVRQDADDGTTRQDDWHFAIAGSVGYEIEDHVTIQLRLVDGQDARNEPVGSSLGPRQYSRFQSVYIGLTYRFAGRFWAPGFTRLSERTAPPAGL